MCTPESYHSHESGLEKNLVKPLDNERHRIYRECSDLERHWFEYLGGEIISFGNQVVMEMRAGRYSRYGLIYTMMVKHRGNPNKVKEAIPKWVTATYFNVGNRVKKHPPF